MTSNSINSLNSGGQYHDGVVLQGYHKKLKTMKKKYFVLIGDDGTETPRLEYYDNEKKFKSKSKPKRVIILKNCFNINRRLDTKQKYVIALSTKEGCFCIVIESEQEMNKWLRALLMLQRGEDTESEPLKPNFEHVWQVQIQKRGLAEGKGIVGTYHVCLTEKSLTLLRIGQERTITGESRLQSVELILTTIRRCGSTQCYFYLEVGRHSVIGAGELWMETEDPMIALNMHEMILNAMKTKTREDTIGPMRKRSSSANEASKPISVLQRRQTHSGQKTINSSPLSGSTLGRERCDSLPSSRNRTISECSNQSINNATMPPPRVIPSLINRPHSIYNNRHSHSPPMNTLSPSTGCSESEGSSLSIDETDSYGNSLIHDESGNLVLFYNPRTSSSGVILEENCDDWLQPEKNHILIPDKLNNHGSMLLSISSNHQMSMRKGGSPASNCHIGSIDAHNQYMDMCSQYSPCGSSPCDQTGNGYVPISPGLEYPPKIGFNGSSTGGHSRGSSLAEENTDGYVPMGPPHPHDYVDMSQTSKTHHDSNMSLAASSSSITSGTPSTDLRFAEYTLEKVQSRFTPDDEEIQGLNEQRPARAYSVGSRIEHKRKLIPTNTAEQNSSRVRAFSVGSRAKVARSDLYRGVFNSNQMSGNNNNNNNTINQDIVENVADVAKGKKSSSVPILVNKSQSSVDRMSDLMEIDYSKNSDRSDSQSDSMSSPTARISSFPVTVPMGSNRTRCDTYGSSPHNSTAPISGYMEMKPGSFDKTISSSPLNKSNYNGYLEMKPGGGSSNSSLGNGIYAKSSSSFSGSPLKTTTASPKPFTKSFTITGTESSSSDYITMSPSTSMSPAMEINTIDKNRISNITSSCDKPMEIDHFPILSQTPDGYMEMSYGKPLSSSSTSSTNQKSENITKVIDENAWSVNRSPSLPINIKTTKDGKTVPGLSFSETLMRTLSQSSDTKEHDLPTPVNNQTTQFMFSPSSPVKPIINNDFTQRKCLVDATSGSVTIAPKADNENKILNTDALNNSVAKKNIEKVDALVNDYADLSLNASKNVQNVKIPQKNNLIKPIVITAESNDYVNYSPGDANKQTNSIGKNRQTSRTTTTTSIVQPKSVEKKIINDSDGDYAVMNPSLTKKYKSVAVSSTSSSSTTTSSSSSSSLSSQASNLTVNCKKIQNQDRKPTTNLFGFKPITSINDEALLASTSASTSNRKSASPKATLNATRNDKKHRKNDSDYGYEMIHIGSDSSIQAKRNEITMHTRRNISRPNSVNSEKISPMKATAGTNRPNSANSDCIQSISASSSTSTLCGSSSSSSTLCGGSKSQSPLSISRPPSIIDYLIVGVNNNNNNNSSSGNSSAGISNYQGNDSSLTDINLLTAGRPSSVTSEKELHYASLDLPPSTTSLDTLGVNTKTNSSSSPGGDSSTSPSPNAINMQQQSTFTYAKIDFNRIESHKAALKAGQGHQ